MGFYTCVSLFTGNDKNEMVLLLHETWNSAILDSACTNNVSGEKWMEDLIQKLNVHDQVIYDSSVKVFNFGGGEKLNSLGTVTFPCVLAGREISITTDVVSSNIPLLLFIKAMKEFGMIWDFQKGTVQVFGREVILDVSSCGHHSWWNDLIIITNIPKSRYSHVTSNMESIFFMNDTKKKNF